MENFERQIEVELVHSLSLENITFNQHFLPEHQIFIDNINGGFDYCTTPLSRESGIGLRYGTWVRARALIYSLLDALKLPPVLAFLTERKDLKGFGVSDDNRYANILASKFDYKNTYYHQEPRLDIMKLDHTFGIGEYDFITCSDVLEHVIGDWKSGFNNLFQYLKPGGVLVFSVPWKKDIEKSIEHYPGCVNYEVIYDNGQFKECQIYQKDGRSFRAKDPCFHGGPGNTLEMFLFSLDELISNALNTGFTSYKLYDLQVPLFGITDSTDSPGVLVFRK